MDTTLIILVIALLAIAGGRAIRRRGRGVEGFMLGATGWLLGGYLGLSLLGIA